MNIQSNVIKLWKYKLKSVRMLINLLLRYRFVEKSEWTLFFNLLASCIGPSNHVFMNHLNEARNILTNQKMSEVTAMQITVCFSATLYLSKDYHLELISFTGTNIKNQ